MSERLDNLLRPVIADLGYELWHLEVGSGSGSAWLRVYIDAPAGIGVDDCEAVSRELAATLAVAGHDYDLEVSSPGIERPLVTAGHFSRFAGEYARLTLYAPVAGQRRLRGIIERADDTAVAVNVDGEVYALAYANIAKAWLDPTLAGDTP